MSIPDRIWAFPKEDWFNAGASTHKIKAAGAKDIEYLRATPARLHAEEMEAALRGAVSALREIRDDNKARGALYSSKTQGLCRASLKVAGGVLAELDP